MSLSQVPRGGFSVGGCQSLPIQSAAVPTDERIYGKTVTHEGHSVFSFVSECWRYQDSPYSSSDDGWICFGESELHNNK